MFHCVVVLCGCQKKSKFSWWRLQLKLNSGTIAVLLKMVVSGLNWHMRYGCVMLGKTCFWFFHVTNKLKNLLVTSKVVSFLHPSSVRASLLSLFSKDSRFLLNNRTMAFCVHFFPVVYAIFADDKSVLYFAKTFLLCETQLSKWRFGCQVDCILCSNFQFFRLFVGDYKTIQDFIKALKIAEAEQKAHL